MSSRELTKELYFTTSTVVDWMDIFTRPVYKHIIIDSLKYCQAEKGINIYAWVLMTNHLHMIIDVDHENNDIGVFFRDFKKYTSKKIVDTVLNNPQESRKEWIINRCRYRGIANAKNKDYQLWEKDNHIEVIWSYDLYIQKLMYIHMNPVVQEIVEKPENYLYSSARDYCGDKGLIDVIVEK